MARFCAVPVSVMKSGPSEVLNATADYPARPGRPHGQTYQHKSPLDDGENISLFAFLVGRTKEQVMDKGIR